RLIYPCSFMILAVCRGIVATLLLRLCQEKCPLLNFGTKLEVHSHFTHQNSVTGIFVGKDECVDSSLLEARAWLKPSSLGVAWARVLDSWGATSRAGS